MAKKATRRRSGKVSGPKKTVKLNGVNYQHVSCSTKKSTAAKAAEAVRKKQGRLARVVKNGKMYCVYKGRKRKSPAKK